MKLGFIGTLTLVFIVLKVLKVITWGWLWVLSPLWLYLILWAVIDLAVTLLMLWVANRE